MQGVSKIVDEAYNDTNKRLLDIMFGKNKLLQHLTALKRYLLLEQGDFVQYLLAEIEPSLSQPGKALFRHNLTSTLEAAIRSSNAQFDDADILKRIDIKILEQTEGETGWDNFVLDYHTDLPINTILTKESMRLYHRLFIFLWKLKRVEYTLSNSWSESMRQLSKFQKLTDVSGDLHHCYILCNEMVNFVYQLQYYFQFQVIESSWVDLMTVIESRKGQDASEYAYDYSMLIKTHEVYLRSLIDKGIQGKSKSHKEIMKRLEVIFDSILKFKRIRERLYSWCTIDLQRRGELEGQDYKLNLERKLNSLLTISGKSEGHGVNASNAEHSAAIVEIKDKIYSITGCFQEEARALLVLLQNDRNLNLKELGQRLNYNNYY